MTIAPLHHTFHSQPTPTYEAVWREHEVRSIFAPLHADLGMCPRCHATGQQPCREGGRFVGRHPGRGAA